MATVDAALAASIASAWQQHAEALYAVYVRHPEPALVDSILRYREGAWRFRALAHPAAAIPPPRPAPALPAVDDSVLRGEFQRVFSESVEPFRSLPLETTSLLCPRESRPPPQPSWASLAMAFNPLSD